MLESHDAPLRSMPSQEVIVSFGYRYRVADGIVRARRCYNLHISLLPWNRGASPNLWAWATGTSHGVTLHAMDSGIDTGPIVEQRELKFQNPHTLRTTYDILIQAGRDLLADNLPRLLDGSHPSTPQTGTGSYHGLAESLDLFRALPAGYDTPVDEVAGVYAACLSIPAPGRNKN